jgi:hypothetical protein
MAYDGGWARGSGGTDVDKAKIFPLVGFRTPNRPARNKSLLRLTNRREGLCGYTESC